MDFAVSLGHALTLNDITRTLTEAGRFEQALPRFRQAISIRRDIARRCWLTTLKIMTDLNAGEVAGIRARLSEL